MNRLLSAFSVPRNLRLLLFRPSTNLSTVDGFRALSMLMILAFHSFAIFAVLNPNVITLTDLVEQSGWTWAWVWNSDKSVDIFLTISGYLITGLLLRQIDATGHIRMSNFYVRRFLRLTPVYYLLIGIYWLAFSGMPGAHTENLWANLIYVNNFLPYDDQAMNWTWSLAIEEQFYVLYPLLLTLLMKHSKSPALWLWGLFVLSFFIVLAIILGDDAIRTTPGSAIVADPKVHAHHFTVLYDNLYTRYGALLAGCLAAYYQHYYPAQVKAFFARTAGKALGYAALVVLTVLMVLPVLTRQFDDWHMLSIVYQTCVRNIYALSIAILILLSTEQGLLALIVRKIMGHPIWYPIAQLSYSMYLVHVLAVTLAASVVGQAVTKLPEKYPYSPFEAIGMVYLISLVITLFFATLFYLFIERPIMNLRK